jgi:hypothetical protein
MLEGEVRELPNVTETDSGSNTSLDEEESVSPSQTAVVNVRCVCHI